MAPYLEKKVIIPGEILYPFSCFLTKDPAGKSFVPLHFHDYIEILYVIIGKVRIQLGNEVHDVLGGSLVLIDSREVHSTYFDINIPTEFIVLKFEPEVFSASGVALEMRYIIPFIDPGFLHKKIFQKEELLKTHIPMLMEETFHEFQNKEYGFELGVIARIYTIFLWILRNSYPIELRNQLESLNTTINIEKLQKVLKYVEDNYKDDIPLMVLSEMCNMSYSYFSRQFSKIIGKTFKEYLNFVRIREAEKLLLTTNMNITEVGLHSGFTNSSYFIKQFKIYKDISPKQYKKIKDI
ncbi:MAG: helix-turn-helix transcriptional regulator [Clostridiaceae bacterium]|nr:helix-turn-helix transcriptional regulator [Clostridiaceae bacterium]